MESLAMCPDCGYRHLDVTALEEKEPSRHTLKIEKGKNLSTRVVRSSRSTLKIPELGIKITPGPDAEGYVSNVEGVLERVENVLNTARLWSDDNKLKKTDKLLKKIENIKNGKEKMTLIIEDPSGNSAIVSKKAKREALK